MEVFYTIISLLGGLALFLYGMRIMGDGLKSGSGGAMKAVLAKVTDKPIKGFLLGLLATCMIQSSTATIVLTVGLVGAGFLTFRQSTGIVLGANIGTAITAQIIRLMDVGSQDTILYFFNSKNLAPLALTIGMIILMFLRKRSSGTAGTILMGFGIIFVGLMNMSTAVSTFSDSLSVLLTSFENNYFLGFLSGVVVTGVIQSSSAVVGILQTIASTMGVSFCGIFAIIIGVNIGDCLTTYLVCRLGAKPEQIRTCMFHIVYNVIAAIFLFGGVAILKTTGVLDGIWNMELDSGGVANVHGLFRIIPAVLFLPFAGLLASVAEKLVSDKKKMGSDDLEYSFSELDERLVANPRLALEETQRFIVNMSTVALHNYRAALQQVTDYEESRVKRIEERESMLDRMTDAVNQYIISISPYIKLEVDNRNQSFQLKAMTCVERIGDLAVNITENINTLHEKDKKLSDMAMKELEITIDAVEKIIKLAFDAFENSDPLIAQKVEPLEEVIDEMIETLRERHMARMVKGQCDVVCGIEFQNILLNLERLSDQCSSLAVYLLGKMDDNIRGQEHMYLYNLHHSDNTEYQTAFHSNYTKYFSMLDAAAAEDEVSLNDNEVKSTT